MTTKHTQGPFAIGRIASPEYAPHFSVHVEGSPYNLATVSGENAKADAILFAAAPDLLAALKEARDSIELSNYAGEENDILALIDAAIASATGDA